MTSHHHDGMMVCTPHIELTACEKLLVEDNVTPGQSGFSMICLK